MISFPYHGVFSILKLARIAKKKKVLNSFYIGPQVSEIELAGSCTVHNLTKWTFILYGGKLHGIVTCSSVITFLKFHFRWHDNIDLIHKIKKKHFLDDQKQRICNQIH